jgi:hypothetical protein
MNDFEHPLMIQCHFLPVPAVPPRWKIILIASLTRRTARNLGHHFPHRDEEYLVQERLD